LRSLVSAQQATELIFFSLLPYCPRTNLFFLSALRGGAAYRPLFRQGGEKRPTFSEDHAPFLLSFSSPSISTRRSSFFFSMPLLALSLFSLSIFSLPPPKDGLFSAFFSLVADFKSVFFFFGLRVPNPFSGEGPWRFFFLSYELFESLLFSLRRGSDLFAENRHSPLDSPGGAHGFFLTSAGEAAPLFQEKESFFFFIQDEKRKSYFFQEINSSASMRKEPLFSVGLSSRGFFFLSPLKRRTIF